jgi:hypothetical protein
MLSFLFDMITSNIPITCHFLAQRLSCNWSSDTNCVTQSITQYEWSPEVLFFVKLFKKFKKFTIKEKKITLTYDEVVNYLNWLDASTCFRASQELAIRYELFFVEDLMVTKMKNSNQSTVPLLGWLLLHLYVHGCWPSGGLMNAGKNLCFANSLLQCLRITDIHKILEHHNCIGLLLNEWYNAFCVT